MGKESVDQLIRLRDELGLFTGIQVLGDESKRLLELSSAEAVDLEEMSPQEIHELVIDDFPLMRTAPALEVIPELDEPFVFVLAVSQRRRRAQLHAADLFIEEVTVDLFDFLLAQSNVPIPRYRVEGIAGEVWVLRFLPVVGIEPAGELDNLGLRPPEALHVVIEELQRFTGNYFILGGLKLVFLLIKFFLKLSICYIKDHFEKKV